MKLYFATGTCSLAARIVLEEAGLRYETTQVNLRQKTLPDGSDYRTVCPQGYVPALQLKNGELLSENPAILQYIADQAPAANLAPANGSFARYRLQSALNFIATELHKNFSPLFDPTSADVTRQQFQQRLATRLAQCNAMLEQQPYLLGEQFSVADAYLFVVLNWAALVKVDLSPYPSLQKFRGTVAGRPAVQRALQAEGLKLT